MRDAKARTKEYLKGYPFYKTTIQRDKEKVNEINAKLLNINATDYSKDRVSGTPTGDILTTLINEKMVLEEKIRRLENICKDIERIVRALPEVKQRIIHMKYMNRSKFCNTSWNYIANQVKYSREHCIRLRDEALTEICVIFED